jgi:hypothetical protein
LSTVVFYWLVLEVNCKDFEDSGLYKVLGHLLINYNSENLDGTAGDDTIKS